MRHTKQGLTLIELMITMVMMVILMGVTVYIFRAILLSWSGEQTRAGIDIGLDSGMDKMVQDIRQARNITNVNSNEIRFTPDQSTFYIYYFYNSSGAYQLKKANWTGGTINNAFDSSLGSGDIIMTDVLPPPTSNLTVSGNMTTIDLSVMWKNETLRSKTQIRPRNM